MKLLVLLCLASSALAPLARAQSTWHVDVQGTSPGDGSSANPYTSLQDCFSQATTLDGDTVLVRPGTYVEDLDLLGKSLDVQSTAGAAQTILEPVTRASVLRVIGVATAHLEGFTVRNGRGTMSGGSSRGGGIECSASTLTLEDCVLTQNHALYGGGLCAVEGSAVSLDACTIASCVAHWGGGIFVSESSLVAFDTDISGSTSRPDTAESASGFAGGGIYTLDNATLELYGCSIRDNQPGYPMSGPFGGGGLALLGFSACLEGCTVANNGGTHSLWSSAGGIHAWDMTLDLVSCTIEDNECIGFGGGLVGRANAVDCDFIENRGGSGGAVYEGGTFTNCRFLGNVAGNVHSMGGAIGGAVYEGVLVNCLLQGNEAQCMGGAAFDVSMNGCEILGNRIVGADHCALQTGGGMTTGHATDCLFEGNEVVTASTESSQTAGGGAAFAGVLTRCTLRGNRVRAEVEGAVPRGGGARTCSLVDCTIEENEVVSTNGRSAQGGGLYDCTATNCSIRGNRALGADPSNPFAMGGGAALSELLGCQVLDNLADLGGGAWKCDLERCTLVGNVASVAGGALSVQPDDSGSDPWGAQVVVDTIAWLDSPDELAPGLGSILATYSDVQGGYPGMGNIAADPRFWNTTARDLHLRADSPCIDSGDPGAAPDPDGSRRDMGALPFDASYVGGPYVYCSAKETSQHCFPSIGASGTPTLTGPDDFVVRASQVVPHQNGILFWGLAPASAPFHGGLRCVAHPLVRTPITDSGGSGACGGELSFHFSHAYLADHGLEAGDRAFAQFWFRDPQHEDDTGVGLSDALDFTVLP